MTSTQTLAHARDIVRRFSVYYEVRPESTLLHDHTIRQVGFCVDLYGRDGQGPPLNPGDERSKEIYRGLWEIASQIVPEEQEDCRYQLDGFDASLHFDSHGSKCGRVQLKIHILHKHGFEQPIDAGETRALKEMEDRLKNLGIHR
jgi:hypothetical protein